MHYYFYCVLCTGMFCHVLQHNVMFPQSPRARCSELPLLQRHFGGSAVMLNLVKPETLLPHIQVYDLLAVVGCFHKDELPTGLVSAHSHISHQLVSSLFWCSSQIYCSLLCYTSPGQFFFSSQINAVSVITTLSRVCLWCQKVY